MTSDRVAAARAEITRRRELAHNAAHHEPARTEEQVRQALTRSTRIGPADVAHIAAVAPIPYALAVLDAAAATLDRHERVDWGNTDPPRECAWCSYDDRRITWPCLDLRGILQVYAPACCALHHDVGCCDPDDCGPCCENCPTCPALARIHAASR